MKLGNIEVKRVSPEVVVVQQVMPDETGCYVSKSSDDSIEGRYLHALAGVVAEASPKVDALVRAASQHLLAIDQIAGEERIAGTLGNLRHALAQCAAEGGAS